MPHRLFFFLVSQKKHPACLEERAASVIPFGRGWGGVVSTSGAKLCHFVRQIGPNVTPLLNPAGGAEMVAVFETW